MFLKADVHSCCNWRQVIIKLWKGCSLVVWSMLSAKLLRFGRLKLPKLALFKVSRLTTISYCIACGHYIIHATQKAVTPCENEAFTTILTLFHSFWVPIHFYLLSHFTSTNHTVTKPFFTVAIVFKYELHKKARTTTPWIKRSTWQIDRQLLVKRGAVLPPRLQIIQSTRRPHLMLSKDRIY